MNYQALGRTGFGYPVVNNGYYGAGPGGIPNGGFCNNMMNQNMFGNPYNQAFVPPYMPNGFGPWGPQIRPLPPGVGSIGRGPQIRPIPNLQSGVPGMMGLPPGLPPPTIGLPGGPYAGSVAGGLPFAPNLYGGAVGVPSLYQGNFLQGVPPPTASLGGQLGVMNMQLNNWGGGAIPVTTPISGGYYGPGYAPPSSGPPRTIP
ncbi:MAG: hypothetical protein ABSF34_21615, partial [Verrucomicrobiota bacterium]